MTQKALYKAACLTDLDKLVTVPICSTSVVEAERIMANLYGRAIEVLEHDEEVAYILLRRYFDFYEHVKNVMKSGPKNSAFSVHTKKQCRAAIGHLENLHASLKRRYAELTVNHHSSENHVRLPSPPRHEPGISVTSTKTKQPDPPPPRHEPEVSVDATKTKQSEPPPQPHIQDHTNNDWISSEALVNLMRKKDSRLLIFDLRSEDDFTSCRLRFERMINFSSDQFLRGTTFSEIASKLEKGSFKTLWCERASAETIVLMDQCSKPMVSIDDPLNKSLPNSHPLLRFIQAISKWDSQRTIKVKPRVLSGGMDEFLFRYSALTTNPEQRVHLMSRKEDSRPSLPDPDHITYPETTRLLDPTDVENEDHMAASESSLGSTSADQPSVRQTDKPMYDSSFSDKSPSVVDDLDQRLQMLRILKPKPTLSDTSFEGDRNKPPEIKRQLKPSTVTPPSTAVAQPVSKDANGTASTVSKRLQDPSSTHNHTELSNGVIHNRTESVPKIPHSNVEPPPVSSLIHGRKIASTSSPDLNSLTDGTEEIQQFPSCHLRPCGLRNLGNSCYMNAVLQSLAHTRALAFFFLRGLDNRFTNVANPLGYGGAVSTQFRRLFTDMWSNIDCSGELTLFKNVVGKVCSTFAGCDQQDSLEFLLFLLDGLHEDLNESAQTVTQEDSSDVDESNLELYASKAWNEHLSRNKSVIVSSFQGQLRSIIQCCVCSKRSSKFDSFMCLSLPVPTRSTGCDLKECLSLFGDVERIRDSYRCPRCSHCTGAFKHLILWRLPTYLIVHLKRFHFVERSWQKCGTFVKFPVDRFQPKLDGPTYSLYAAVNHYGTMESGHYTAFCRGMSDALWYEYDDRQVRQVPASRLHSNAAYILFYERLPRIDVFSPSSNV